MAEFAIDPRCINCPAQALIQQRYVAVDGSYQGVSELGEMLVGEEGQFVDEYLTMRLTATGVPEDKVPDTLSQLRQTIAQSIDRAEEVRAKYQTAGTNLSSSCEGTLKMRANRSGTTYTVTLCTAGALALQRQNINPAIVERRPSEGA